MVLPSGREKEVTEVVRNTYTLINTIKKMYPVVNFFKDRYYPDGRVYYSEEALIETKEGGRKAAPFVSPVVNGIVMESEGYRTDRVNAPYIIPKKVIMAKDLEKKAFGEDPNSGRSPDERENELEAEYMDELRKSIYRRHEAMCTELTMTGKVIMKHYSNAEDAARDRNYETMCLKFYDDKFENEYVIDGDFTTMSAKEKLATLYDIVGILRRRGIKATDLVMTADVSRMLMTDEKFLDYYDKQKVNTGKIDQKELPEGVVCNGDINILGVTLTMFTYDEEYQETTGEIKEFLPKGTIAFLHPGMGVTSYAQVTFVKGEHFNSFAEKIVPRLVTSEENNQIELQMFSRPVMYPLDRKGWIVANIYQSVSAGDRDDEDADALEDTDTSEGTDDAGEGSSTDGVTLLTEDEINAMTTKAAVIEYGESIGMTGLSDSDYLADLKAAVISYQEEVYGE